jgi:hypothetical protein
MQLIHNRTTYTDKSVIGTQVVIDSAGNNVFSCVTLEPPQDLTLSIKPRAIPEGTYGISIFFSAHLQCKVLLLANVPGFGDVEEHFGNFPKNTLGCILVGETVDPNVPDQIDTSRVAFNKLMAIVEAAINSGDTVTVTVTGNQTQENS